MKSFMTFHLVVNKKIIGFALFVAKSIYHFSNLTVNEQFIENWRYSNHISDDLTIIPNDSFQNFVDSCNSVADNTNNYDENEIDLDFPTQINSKYHDIDHFNTINPNPLSSFNIVYIQI